MDNFANDSDDDMSSVDGEGFVHPDRVANLTEFARERLNFDVIPPSRWDDASEEYPPFYGRMMLQVQESMLRTTADLMNHSAHHVNIGHRFDVEGDERYLDDEADEYDDYDYAQYLAKRDVQLDPIWRSLTNAIHGARNLSSLSLSGIQLSGEVYDMLSLALQSKTIESMTLNGVDLGSEGLSFVAAHVEGNPLLRELYLQNDRIHDLDIAARLFAAVKRHGELCKASLSSCEIGTANNELLRIIMDGCANLICLNLECNEIGSEGARLIANALAKNPSLEILCLDANAVGDDGVDKIARALASNRTLVHLALDDNKDVTEAGRDMLMRDVYNTSSLNAIKDSNHSRRIICSSDNEPPRVPLQSLAIGRLDSNQQRYVPYDMQVRIKSKLLFALGAFFDQGPLNIQYLSDVPLELMPRVLSFVQMTNIVPETVQRDILGKLIATETPLRNVFEVVKHCLVPLLLVPQSPERKSKRGARGSGEEATRNGEGSTLTHEPRKFPNRIPIDGKLSEQQCYAACELLDEFLNKSEMYLLDRRICALPYINSPKLEGTSEPVLLEGWTRIYSLAWLLRKRLDKHNDSNGVVELLSCSGDVYNAYDEYDQHALLREDIKKLCSFLNLSPCHLGITV